MVDIKRMAHEWRRKGFKDEEVAEAIGMTPRGLKAKIWGEVTGELSATQNFVICDMIGSPYDMFITKDDAQ